MVFPSHDDNFAEPVPFYLRRRDMPDGRTRLHSISQSEPGDIQGMYDFDSHRVIDRAARTAVLDLWPLDCGSEAEWRDGALDLLVQPGDLRLRIDLARGEYRLGGDETPWVPLDGLQARMEHEIGTGFGYQSEGDWEEIVATAASYGRDAPLAPWKATMLLILFGLGWFVAVAWMLAVILDVI